MPFGSDSADSWIADQYGDDAQQEMVKKFDGPAEELYGDFIDRWERSYRVVDRDGTLSPEVTIKLIGSEDPDGAGHRGLEPKAEGHAGGAVREEA